jgi:predicted negative regulator of RcsB-dependent stress response
VAKYTKKRARELKHDKFRDTTMNFFDRLGDLLAGKGRIILYSLAAIIALAVLFGLWSWRSARKTDEASLALGRAIEIATAPVTPSPSPGATALSFPNEKERATKAIEEFQKVADKYSGATRENAQYFIATNLLTVDHDKGISQLEALTKSGDEKIATLAKFALAQAREADGQYETAAAIYNELAKQDNPFVSAETAKLRLASVYEKQGKKKEAVDLLFPIVEAARQAKDKDGKPTPQSAAAREAAQKLERLDPDRFAQLPPEPPPAANDLTL